MKQIATAAFMSIGVLALLAVVGFLLIQHHFSNEEEAAPPISASEKNATQQAKSPASQEEFAGSSKGSVDLSDDMREFEVQLYLHEMTHNKVYADIKFGSQPLTSESIARLIEIVEKNDYRDESFYLITLDAWQRDDFSNAVKVHNTIWNWHNGTIGKATRLLTEQEEQNYADVNF